jgi:hypothetical protein
MGVALVSLVLAFGTRLGPIYALLYERVPLWSSLRVAVAPVVLAQLAIALLAARGMLRLTARIPPRGRGLVLGAVVALLVLDFGLVAWPVLLRATGDASALNPPPPSPLARVAQRDPHARIAPLDKPSFLSDDPVAWRVRSLGGVHGSASRAWNTARERNLLGRYGVLCALGVKWVASDTLALDDPELFSKVEGAPAVRRVVHALPRAYGIPRVAGPLDDEAVYAALGSDEFVPDAIAYASDARAVGDYPGSAGLALDWTLDDPDAIELLARAPAPAYVVIADAWFAGWRARIDGTPVPLDKIDGLVRGVAVPAGTHRVRLDYEPPGWRVAVGLSRIAWGVLAACAIVLRALGLKPRVPA